MNPRPHAWRRKTLPELPERIEVRCALCNVRRDAFESKGLNPDDDTCPLTHETLCRAINSGNRSVCRLPPHEGDHREVFNSTWLNVADMHGGTQPFPDWPHGVPVLDPRLT